MIHDATFRASIRLKESPKVAEAGILIDLPEFGQTRDDLGDVVLVDGDAKPQPLAKVWRGEGGRVLLLARSLEKGKNYHVYLGGNILRISPGWTPKTSLLMETRRLPDGAKFESWGDMQKTWKSALETDGAGFVRSIYQGGNPFGPGTYFVTHYTGWLETPGLELVLYTLSSDASFVLVNDNYEFGWPGFHSPWATAKSLHSKKVNPQPDFTKIDYYHAKAAGDQPATVLGWQKNGTFEAIPAEAWLHPGTSAVQKIEERHGWPVPIANTEPLTYLGYGNQWYFETKFSLPTPLPEGWNAEWQFEDGALVSGTEFQRVIVGMKPQTVTLRLRSTSGETRGVKRFFFPDDLRAASINNPDDLARYFDLMAKETPARLSVETLKASLELLLDFGVESQAAGYAEAWLQKNPDPHSPLWLPAQRARLLSLAQSDPKKALDELRRFDLQARKSVAQPLDLLELDLLVFYLRDDTAPGVANRIAFQYANTGTARLAKIRAGDFYRLKEQYKQAVEQYQGVQKTVVDETAGRKLPAQDQAYSITIRNLLEKKLRNESSDKLREWELKHPMAKFDSDYLLLRGRTLCEFGRWTEALAELDSFKKIQHDSPWLIDADFYRAGALWGLGKKDEARQIWSGIAKNYPKHDLAEEAKRMASSQ